ncbi:hypothetical protein CPTAKMNP4_064 [Salmonella phage vB_SenM-AKM_NP4]|uniref:Uncharacterized protein n=2 Tax=Gelderlandvirus TaxID=1913653 RepID=M1HNR9_BPS16|nr:hypothetical protein I133_gp207 [Salmonella phage vB_SenM-S16]YP_009126269.1 hypothetical protein STP4a_061 [Salmonella phage STP4-a]UFK27188.1 hypothetical protein LG358_00167 [Escherichia phage UoN_LG358_1]WDR21730.1 hypothetical protein PJM34_0062 [Salmonella phage vB_SenM_UTK0003]WKV23412.1 hypothetical protein SEA1_gp0064 [Salmonella phage SEA1]WLI71689.1 hypothetical protein CPTAKMNP4_064 [Salmonella phage vB_SenM-AKM_NP4]AGE48152.1 hypothetical protein [Salmonella phage vB_SenM-S16]
MTYQEAVMTSKITGKCIRHEYFTSDEYFIYDNGTVRDNGGYDMTRWYKGEAWQDKGWYVEG